MRAEIVSVGTELLLGQIVDTNAAYLAQQLAALGIDVYWISQIGDNRTRLVEMLRRAWGRSELIVITGGLGPTEDDLTREAIAELLGEEMVVQPDLAQQLRTFFAQRGRPMPERNLKQATLIPSARAVPNPVGTAPGWWVEREGRTIVTMPGVPSEMYRMWQNEVLPLLRQRQGDMAILSRNLKVLGLGESTVEEMIRPLLSSNNPTLATYAKADGVHVRVTAKATTRSHAEEMVAAHEEKVRAILGENIYGVDEETLEAVVGRMLRERSLTLATMESCTGGMLANALTNTPGSSDYFKGGLVAYSREAKVAWGVDAGLIQRYGTISRETAQAMASAARRQLGASMGLAITGVAGPALLEGQPVGTVHIALDDGNPIATTSGVYGNTRPDIKRRASLAALDLLRRSLAAAKA